MTPVERLEELARAAGERGTRALIVLETSGADAVPSPGRGEGHAPPDAPRTAAHAPRHGPVRGPDRIDLLTARLGTENLRLVHDARHGLDPALLAAEAGTVPAGGVLLLLLSPLDEGAPIRSRLEVRTARLLCEYVAAEPAIGTRLALSGDAATALLRSALAVTERTGPVGAASGSPPLPVPMTNAALAEQDELLDRAVTHLRSSARPLVVIEAPRGHGKSALLGRLAAELVTAGVPHALCAARRPAIDVLERHRRLALPAGGAPSPFLPPDAAVRRGGDTLLVDEAASLPLPVLERLLERWRRVVLATTSAGYESAGRAFALRLPATLDRERPGWLRLTPSAPMRWRAGDPLDALLARLALSATTLAEPSPGTRAELEQLSAYRVDRDALSRDEARLASLFGLLAATHYQSSPLDLAHLLDGDDVALWSIERAGDVLATALVAIEPGIEPALHADVLARRRRLPHRLLPQLLAQSADRGDALAARFARVVRIAVHPSARRLGLGSRLVAAVVRDTADEVEAVGASFGETAATVAFWSSNGFTTFHRGYRRNPRSGRCSIAVLRAGSARTGDVLGTAAAIHRDNVSADRTVGTEPVATRDVALLERFANGERALSDTRAAAWRLVRSVTDDRLARGASGRSVDVAADARQMLDALALAAPPSRRRQEARLRRWVRERLDAAR